MELNGIWQVFLGGMLGPLLLELVKLAGWQNASKVANRYRTLRYWVGTAALFILGGVVAVINGVEQIPILRAVEFGIGAPALIVGYLSASKRRGASFIGDAEAEGGSTGDLRSLLAW